MHMVIFFIQALVKDIHIPCYIISITKKKEKEWHPDMEVVTMVPCKGNPLLYKNWYLWRWPAQVWYFSTSSSHSHQIWIHNFSKPNCRSFWDSLHIIISVIDIVKAEAERVTIVPLKIINVGPHEKATNICSLPVWKLEKARNGFSFF